MQAVSPSNMELGIPFSCIGIFKSEKILLTDGYCDDLSFAAACHGVKSGLPDPSKTDFDSKRPTDGKPDLRQEQPEVYRWYLDVKTGDGKLKVSFDYKYQAQSNSETLPSINFETPAKKGPTIIFEKLAEKVPPKVVDMKTKNTLQMIAETNPVEISSNRMVSRENRLWKEKDDIVLQELNGAEHHCEGHKMKSYITAELRTHKLNTEFNCTIRGKATVTTKLGYLVIYLLVLQYFCSNAAAYTPNATGLIPLTNCSQPLTSCPKNSDFKFRELCVNSFEKKCPSDSSYLCGPDKANEFIIERCQPIKECRPGTALTFEVNPNSKEVTAECLQCLGKRFETEYRLSNMSSSTNACTYEHKESETISQHLVLDRMGTVASPTIWHCDAQNGFYEIHRWMYCDDIPSHPCDCQRKTCPYGRKLRPDGMCVRCHTRLNPEDNWHCEAHTWTKGAVKTMISTKSTTISRSNVSYTTTRPNITTYNTDVILNHTLHHNPTNNKGDISRSTIDAATGRRGEAQSDSPLLVIITVVAIAAIAMCVLLLCCYLRRRSAAASSPVHDPENPSTPLQEEFTDERDNSTHDTDQNNVVINEYKNCQIGNNNSLKVNNSQTDISSEVKIEYTYNIGSVIFNSNVGSNGKMSSSPSSNSDISSQCPNEGDDLTPNQRMDHLKSFQRQHGNKGLPEDLMMDCSNVLSTQVDDPDETKRKEIY